MEGRLPLLIHDGSWWRAFLQARSMLRHWRRGPSWKSSQAVGKCAQKSHHLLRRDLPKHTHTLLLAKMHQEGFSRTGVINKRNRHVHILYTHMGERTHIYYKQKCMQGVSIPLSHRETFLRARTHRLWSDEFMAFLMNIWLLMTL